MPLRRVSDVVELLVEIKLSSLSTFEAQGFQWSRESFRNILFPIRELRVSNLAVDTFLP
jgi:hypothetical protein